MTDSHAQSTATQPASTEQPERVDLRSHDIVSDKQAELVRLFPEVRTEGGKIDFDRLKCVLGEIADSGKERYGMNWAGKADCFKAIQSPSLGTLLPVPEESLQFEVTDNLIVEGDNLEVLKLMQKAYLGKIKMIYIDPPYNTGNDFIYPDNYSESLQTYLEYTGQVDTEGRKFSTNTEADGRFHSKWMNMMYPRLYLARNLLKEDGLIFISIDDREVDNLKKICNDVFGEENFLGCAARVSKKANNQGDYWSPNFDYVVTYSKDRTACVPFFGGVNYESYDLVDDDGPRKGEKYQLLRLYMTSLDPLRGCTNQRYYIEAPDGTLLIPPGTTFPKVHKDGEFVVPQTADDKVWRWTKAKYLSDKQSLVIRKARSSNLVDANGAEVKWNVFTKTYLNDVIANASAKPNSLIEDHINQISSHELGELDIPFDFAKPSTLISYLCEISGVKDNDIVLDFFAGSGSTGHGVLDLNARDNGSRKFILIQLPEPTRTKRPDGTWDESTEWKAGFKTIAEITKERVRRVAMRLNERAKEKLNFTPTTAQDRGFRVFRLNESNFTLWNPEFNRSVVNGSDGVSALTSQMDLLINHIRPNRSADDLLWELLIKSGFPLSTRIDTLTIANKKVFSISGDAMLICLEKDLTLELIRAIAEKKSERVILLDEGFAGNDQLKTNAVQIMKSKGVTSFRTV